ncbi:type IV conjugative transfer system protein TraE [Massilia sp. TS11]|uniref:type IV conjugative transfer system protein TraE n=1 Tax=Massilia sp. TS11 TaxID=2908003 RepID=UPI001EDC11C7|nr:type IV conjugative transfer system protein TraE [Massilia sp. TS11]MCG2583892.1 type IV conjugative transfer system protein TraE [Massilia sp. TS11]
MDADQYKQDIKALTKRTDRLTHAVLLQAIALVCVALWGARMVGAVRTILMPAAPQKTFWVTDDHADQAYLEEMAGYFAWLILDVSAESIDWKKETLLKYTLPEEAAAFRTRMDLEADRLRKINGSSTFALRQLRTDEKAQTVTLVGTEHVRVNGVETSAPQKSYSAAFVVIGGRIHLKRFEEVSDEKQANPPPAAVGMR